jgi:hypothetical protein
MCVWCLHRGILGEEHSTESRSQRGARKRKRPRQQAKTAIGSVPAALRDGDLKWVYQATGEAGAAILCSLRQIGSIRLEALTLFSSRDSFWGRSHQPTGHFEVDFIT